MDLLVVVGDQDVPAFILDSASHVVRTREETLPTEVVAHLRTHVPRHVGVIGSASVAVAISDAGFAVTYFTADTTELDAGDGRITVSPLTDLGSSMDIADSVLELVGNTPIVRLSRVARDVPPLLLAKLEYFNPGGSVKDRPAITMIEEAERQGLLKRGGTIVEPTSGNTGVGLAIVAARKKYRCVFVVPDKVSSEKINLLRAYGAEVIVCPTAVTPDHPESYYSVSDRLAREIPGAYKPDQYSNPANPLAHEHSTGPEIWRQTNGRITHLVAGVGTAGTIVGTARYLKQQNPDIQIVGADPKGSVYSGGTGRPYMVEGVGEDFFPANYDSSIIDRVIAVSDRDAFMMARRLTSEEGVFVGGSAGMAVVAALKLGSELSSTDVVVAVLPDSGRGYLSKLFSDAWLADYGFLRSSGRSTTDVLANKRLTNEELPEIVHVHPHETVREVAAIMREYGVSQVIVVNAEPPLVMGEVIGSANEEDLLRKAFVDRAMLDEPIADHMGRVPVTVGTGESIDVAIERLQEADALLVVDAGHPVGVLTRSDLLDYLGTTDH